MKKHNINHNKLTFMETGQAQFIERTISKVLLIVLLQVGAISNAKSTNYSEVGEFSLNFRNSSSLSTRGHVTRNKVNRDTTAPTNCSSAVNQYFDFLASILESSVRYTLDGCDLYKKVKNFSSWQKNRDLVNGINFSKDEFASYKFAPDDKNLPDLSCNVHDGYNVAGNDFCEPCPPPCLIAGIYYAQLHKDKLSTIEAEGKTGALLYALVASSKNGGGEKIFNLIADDCMKSNDTSKVYIFDVFVLKSMESTFNYFHEMINKKIKYPYKKELDKISMINVTCKEAFERINTQFTHWHKMLIFADYKYSYHYNLTKYYPQSYEIRYGDTIAYYVNPELMKYASYLLSSDGYIRKNIDDFKKNCICEEKSTQLNKVIHPNTLNSFIKNNETNKTQLLLSMDKIYKELLSKNRN